MSHHDPGVEEAVCSRSAPALGRKVLHVINGQHYSGAERVQDLLALSLPDLGVDVGFACLSPGKFPLQRRNDAPLYRVPMRFSADLSAAKRLVRLAEDDGYDLLHAHTVRSVMIVALASQLTGLPYVYHVHSPVLADSTRWVANRVNAVVEHFSLRRASAILCVSHSLADHMVAHRISRDRLTVVPNGVPTCESLSERSVPSGQWTLGTVALFRPRKGTEVLLESLATLRRSGYDVCLHAVGPFETKEYEHKLVRLVESLGLETAVHWTGFTQDVNAELDKMDVMVLPSLFGEGLPMVVLEAMAAGVPVVGTQVEGIPEVLRAGAGILTAPGSAESLTRAIQRLLHGVADWESIRRTAWSRQRAFFSDHSMAAGVARVYEHVLGSGSAESMDTGELRSESAAPTSA